MPVYGIEKLWRQLNREDRVRVGRDRPARAMRDLNLEGVVGVRGSGPRWLPTTTSDLMIWSTGTSEP